MRELLVSDHRTVRSRSRNPPQGPAPQGAQPGAEPMISSGGFFAGLLQPAGWVTLRVILYCCSTRGLVDNLDNVVISVYNKMGDGWHLKNRPSGCDISYPLMDWRLDLCTPGPSGHGRDVPGRMLG